MKTYLTNCEYIMERQANYDKLTELRAKFVAVKDNYEMNGFSGNLAAHVSFNRKTKKAKFNKAWSTSDDSNAAMYQAIPSALALYRLCCFDEVKVEAQGQNGYKCTWSVALVHAPSGKLVVFGEHKGAFSFWTAAHGEEMKDKAFIKDLTDFLTYLVSDNFAHPYDGLVAGSVA